MELALSSSLGLLDGRTFEYICTADQPQKGCRNVQDYPECAHRMVGMKECGNE